MLREALIAAAENHWLRSQVTGRRLTRALAFKYVAGETLDDGLAVTRALARAGRCVTLDYLGEAVTTADAARAAAKVVIEAVHRIADEGLPAGVSVKPTQMGLELSAGLCRDLLDEIAAACGSSGQHLTLDMEGSDVTEATVAMVQTLRAAGHHDVGCAVQSYLRRTRDDVERLSTVGASVRLCKGAYAEPPAVAFSSKEEVFGSYTECTAYLLERGTYPRLATHDERLIAHAMRTAGRLGLQRSDFEFQMLYGVRPSLQQALVDDGWRLRVYVPFGDQWYPYYMRRLGERPANLIFFLRALRDT